jgi:tetratricopeptide (TPR) repeat protein
MDRTVALADGRVEAALARGNYLYYVRGDYRGALAEFRDAAETLGETTDLQFGIAAVLRRLARHDEATALFESIVGREPRHTRAVFELAYTYLVRRRWADAEARYERYIDLAPDQPVAFGGLAQIALLGRGDTVAARRVIERWRALDEDPAGLAAVWGAQLAQVRGERPDLGVFAESNDGSEWQRYQLYPDGPVDLWRARMLWVRGDSAEARTLVEGLAQAYLDETPGARADANVLPPDGDLFGARATERALRGWERLFAGDRDEALRLADEAVRLYPIEYDAGDGYEFLRQRALVRTLAGDHAGAVADLRTLLSIPSYTTVPELRLDPIYDPLRGREDFQALVSGG